MNIYFKAQYRPLNWIHRGSKLRRKEETAEDEHWGTPAALCCCSTTAGTLPVRLSTHVASFVVRIAWRSLVITLLLLHMRKYRSFSSVLPGAEPHICQAHCQHPRSRSVNASFRLTTWRHEQGVNNYNVSDKGLKGNLWSPQRRGHVFRGRHRRRHSHFHFDQRHQSEESLGEAERRCQCPLDRGEWRRWDNLQCAQEVLQSKKILGGRKR